MEINFDYKDCIYSIEKELAKIPEDMQRERRTILNKSAKLLKSTVENSLRAIESNVSPRTTNYDGSLPYVHMADDVKTSIQDDKAGTMFAIIRGGKMTGYKWHMLENGTSQGGTTRTNATHFIEKALKQTEAEIEAYIDEAIRKAVQGGGQG